MKTLMKTMRYQIACLLVFCLLAGLSKGSYSVFGVAKGKTRKATIASIHTGGRSTGDIHQRVS